VTRRILVVANDHVGTKMAGPGIRSYQFARALQGEGDVTLVVPFPTDVAADGFDVVVANPWDAGAMTRLARGADCVVAQRLPVPTMLALARAPTRCIYDLSAPLPIEHLARGAGERAQASPASLELNLLTHTVALQTADALLCASETQRDLWLGSLLQAGRIDERAYAADPSLRSLIDVVPYGIDDEPPRPGSAMKGVWPGIGADDTVLLWPGGIWNWFDPLTVIDAVAEVSRRRPDVRLVFLGMQHPNPMFEEMAMAQKAVARAEELGLRDRIVFFNDGWVPYDERGAYLLEADLGVSAHFDDLESRFAFRTRLLDCWWAGLPVIATRGDALGELVTQRGLGRGVAVEDVAGWAEAIEELLGDRAAYDTARRQVEEVRDEFRWTRVLAPLLRLVREPATTTPHPPTALPTLSRWASLRLRHALAERGATGAARQAAAGAIGRARSRYAGLR
jgi:glycosyltransferase involved in cell wall biosynthesis